MRIKTCVLVCVAATNLGLVMAVSTASAEDAELSELKREIETLKRGYEERLRALEQRVEAAERRAEEPPPASEATAPETEEPTRTATAIESVTNVYGRLREAFNPSVGVVVQGRAAYLQDDAGERRIPGFLTGGEGGRGPEGLALGESELIFSANVDDKLYGFFDVSFDQDEIGIEEAYLSTLGLPFGFSVKAGQFLSAIGYQNDRHPHNWDFVDQPLVYEAMLGGALLDPGIQLYWIAPTDLYLELGGEILRGDAFPAGGSAHHGFGALTGFAKLSGDLDESNTWQLGVAYLRAESKGRESNGGNGATLSLDGSSDLFLVDFVWKWAPDGNFRERNFALQTEYMHRRERGALSDQSAMLTGRYRGNQDGFYVQGVYQFVPRWRLGARYGQLLSDDFVRGLPSNVLDQDGSTPRRVSAMLDFSNSEFSRLRLQYSFESGGLGDDSLVFLQYIISIGAHGAHAF